MIRGMKFSIITLFPEMFSSVFSHSILKRAQQHNLLGISYVPIRDFGIGRHRTVDDRPYGGGAGMVMRVDVIEQAIAHARCAKQNKCKERVILLGARGSLFQQKTAKKFSTLDHIILVCGHYEGVDERIREYIDEEVSVGDYVVTGGELPAMIVVDAVTRLIPNVLGKSESNQYESFQETSLNTNKKASLLEYPQYTRPQEYKGLKVPNVLLSGNHQKVDLWRLKQAVTTTKRVRPDLLS